MKKLLLHLFVFLAAACTAQNYSTLTPGRNSSFSFRDFSGAMYCDGVRPDTVLQSAGFVEFRDYRREMPVLFFSGNCMLMRDTGWTGHRIVLESATGSTWYFNAVNDSIYFDATAGLGQTGFFYRFPNGDKIRGTVVSVTQGTVLSATDSLHTLTLQAEDPAGSPVANDFNGKQIVISKNYGIVKSYSWNAFPNDTTSFTLHSLTNPQMGPRNVHAADIYNFDIGDQFDLFSVKAPSSSADPIEYGYISLDVTGKTVSANGDTIHYTYMREYVLKIGTTIVQHMVNQSTETRIISRSDSLYEFKLNHLEFNNGPDTLNGYRNVQPLYPYQPGAYNNRDLRGWVSNHDTYYDNTYSCFVDPFIPGIVGQWTFADGLGMVSFEGHPYDTSLVYYKKGAETWGTPINWSLILSDQQVISTDILVKTWPNPAGDILNAELGAAGGQPVHYQIFNSFGQLLVDQNVQAGAGVLQVPVSELPAGFYIFKAEVGGRTMISRFMR
jgi:hypothetical protein